MEIWDFMRYFEPNMGQNMGFIGNMENMCSVGSLHWSKKCSATSKETNIQDTTETTGTNESGETEVEKSACELDDRETSSSSSKKINYYSLG